MHLSTGFFWLACGLAAVTSACTFDGSALGDRACDSDDDCAGAVCVAGFCMGNADDTGVGDLDADGRDADAAADAADADVLDAAVDAGSDADASDGGGDSDAPACSDESAYCEGDEVVACVEGAWTPTEDCASEASCSAVFGCRCERGACVERTCAPGTRRCAGAVVTECDAAGRSFVVVEACDPGQLCDEGACVDVDCVPNAVVCVGETLIGCDGSGAVATRDDCAFDGSFCDSTQTPPRCRPAVCAPGSLACGDSAGVGTNGEVARCDDRGAGYEVISTCDAGELCRDGICAALACASGETACVDDVTAGVCNAAGTGFDAVACDAASFCEGGECVPQRCAPDQTRCSADGAGNVERCNDIGSIWVTEGACPEATACVDGACATLVCTPGAAFCDADGNAARCSDDGTAVATVDACAFACASGVCAPSVCGDGIVDGTTGETCDDGNGAACDGCESCALRSTLGFTGASSTSGGPGWSPGDSTFAIEAWIRPTGTDGAIAGLGESNGSDFVRLELVGGRPSLRYGLGGGDEVVAISGRTVTPGTWTHVAGVRNGATSALLFVDGVLTGVDNPDVSRTSIDAGAGRLWLGSDGRLPAFAGELDEARVSNSARYVANFVPSRRLDVDGATVLLVHLDDSAGGSAAVLPDGMLTLASAVWSPDTCLGSPADSLRCGDGQRARWEACDDGGIADGDGCSSSCAVETGCSSGVARVGAAAGGCYVSVQRGHTWDDARRACGAWGAELATVGSAGENEWLAGTYGLAAWIGLTDSGFFNEGTFRWASGATDEYRNWVSGEPNDGGSILAEEDCVEMRGDGRWNDLDCADSAAALCER